MTDEEFEIVLDKNVKRMVGLIGTKKNEYAREDRLSNFKKAGPAMGTTPERALIGFWMKHVISLVDMVNDLDNGKVAPAALWDEKIGDAMTYLPLLDGLITERLK